MNITIRTEEATDHTRVFTLVEKAFKGMVYSNHEEQFLVERLRKSAAFVPALSLVAIFESQIIGFILLTKVHIKNESQMVDALTLAPVAVLPEFHRQGIGGQLIRAAHRRAKEMGYKSVVLLGHADYYPKFGYEKTSKYGIKLPFEAKEENCMIIALEDGALEGVNGVVVYPSAFFKSE